MSMDNRVPLSELQERVYRIFVEFDRICRKHDIKYSMEGGTLLGAVKYKNFVPWDDDIDVIMIREEYDRFLEVAPNELSKQYFLQSYNNVRQFPLNYAKLCDNDTCIYDYDYTHLTKMNHGIFIDIFPIDNVIPSKLSKQLHIVGMLTSARKTKLKINFGKVGLLKKVIFGMLSILPMSFLCNQIDKCCSKYNKKKTDYRYEVCNSNKKFSPLPYEIYEELVELDFRDSKFYAIKEYDRFLQSRFGENYLMELPDENLRKPSHNPNIKILRGER